MVIARVEILPKHRELNFALDYQIPSGVSAPPGSLVRVPLANRVVEGVVIGHADHSEFGELKEILEVGEICLSQEMLDLAAWLAVRAGCTVSSILSAMLPPEKREQREPPLQWIINPISQEDLTEKQQMVADFLDSRGPMTRAQICRALGISPVPVNNLINRNILVPADTSISSGSWQLDDVEELTAEQAAALAEIEKGTDGFQKGAEFLLYGVTGSGKTEVYIRLARTMLVIGRQALILVPEIALTAQLVARFKQAFREKVAVLHSGLKGSTRYAQWDRIYRGEAGIVIGTRSAVFAPLSNLGLVVLDEEHEPAYKQEETPRYHARDAALFRARWHKAAVVLGSATPALESFARAEKKRYNLIEMPRRIYQDKAVSTEVVDMRQELHQGNRDMLSRSLQKALAETLARDEQALLFLNRRGVAPTVLCRQCGFRYACSNCSTSLTLHQHGILKCHHCGLTIPVAKICPECGSKYLRELGLGTQKLEKRLQTLFPGCSIFRLDRDAARSAEEKEQQLYSFYQQGAGILLGTQMIAKGLDFPRVTLVGIVLADLSLAVTDFRGAERTFQLITQAAGRTGRDSHLRGRVIVQTYQPEHYGIRFAVAGDYRSFYRYEMGIRSRSGLPPFSALTRIILSAREQKYLLSQVEQINDTLDGDCEQLFSGPAPLEKLKGRFRWHILLRHSGSAQAWKGIDSLRRKIRPSNNVRIVFDNNPHNFM